MMGTCSYYLMYAPNFDIIVDNIVCGHNDATCTKSVSIDINGMNIKLDHNHQVYINGRPISNLPYEIPGLKIFMVSSLFLEVCLIKILFQSFFNLQIKIMYLRIDKRNCQLFPMSFKQLST